MIHATQSKRQLLLLLFFLFEKQEKNFFLSSLGRYVQGW